MSFPTREAMHLPMQRKSQCQPFLLCMNETPFVYLFIDLFLQLMLIEYPQIDMLPPWNVKGSSWGKARVRAELSELSFHRRT